MRGDGGVASELFWTAFAAIGQAVGAIATAAAVAVYARVSTDMEEQASSFEARKIIMRRRFVRIRTGRL